MASNTQRKPLNKKAIQDLNSKGAKGVERSNRNQMKNFGDEFDPRPKGKVLPKTPAKKARKI